MVLDFEMQRVNKMDIHIEMRSLLKRCIEEDGGLANDVTTSSIIPQESYGRFALRVREEGVLAGLNLLLDVVDEFGEVSIEAIRHDGERVHNETVGVVEGNIRSILGAERTVLNILGYASGIATRTKKFVDAVEGLDCNICDTRKTTPGLRQLDKYAVTCGGGTSHRMGLHDAALFKDNHLAMITHFEEELREAIVKTKENSLDFVMVEVDTLEQLSEVIRLPIDIVLLDNMSTELLKEAVAIRDASHHSPLLEASGNVNLNTVREIAESGVDRISIGGLIHQATWLDVVLDSIDA